MKPKNDGGEKDFDHEKKVYRNLEKHRDYKNLAQAQVLECYELETGKAKEYLIQSDYGKDLKKVFFSFNSNEQEKILKQIANGLREFHAADYVHGDLKFANVMYKHETGQIKLVDYGSSTTLGEPRSSTFTPEYVAPEHYHSEGYIAKNSDEIKLTQKEDIFSYGTMVLKSLKGHKEDSLASGCKTYVNIPVLFRQCLQKQVVPFFEKTEQTVKELCSPPNTESSECKRAKIALLCVNPDPKKRPIASEILKYFESIHNIPSILDDKENKKPIHSNIKQ